MSLQIRKDVREGREIVCFQFLLTASEFFLLVKQDLDLQNVAFNYFLSKISISNRILKQHAPISIKRKIILEHQRKKK